MKHQIDRVESSRVAAHIGETVAVCGWLHARRALGAITFVVLRDGFGTLQCVVQGPVEVGVESVLRLRYYSRKADRQVCGSPLLFLPSSSSFLSSMRPSTCGWNRDLAFS